MTARLRRISAMILAVCLAAPGCARKTDRLACSLCGAEKLEVDELSHQHGVGVCALQAPCRVKGHYLLMGEEDSLHGECGICGEHLCSGSHGQGRCRAPATPEPTLEPTPAPGPEPTPAPAPTPEPEPTPTPERAEDEGGAAEDLSAAGDWTLEDFYVTFEDGTERNLSDPEKRKGVTCTGQSYATITAVPRSGTAQVTGDVGRVTLQDGENSFSVTVTAANGRSGVFDFVITNE